MKVGLDVGGTKTDVVAVDGGGAIVGRVRLATGWGPEAVTRTVLDAVRALGTEAGVDIAAIRSVGIGIPGQVEPRQRPGRARGQPRCRRARPRRGRGAHPGRAGPRGERCEGRRVRRVRAARRIRLDGLPQPRHRHRRRHRARMASCGAARAARPERSGTSRWIPRGPPCRCGQRGCIEALAGGGAIAERWARPGALPVRDVFDAADQGDPIARELRSGLARGVASAVRILVLTADVDAVVLGGGVTALGDRLMTDVAAELARQRRGIPVHALAATRGACRAAACRITGGGARRGPGRRRARS